MRSARETHRHTHAHKHRHKSKPKAFGFPTGLGGPSGPTPHKPPTRPKPKRAAPPKHPTGPYSGGAKPGATREPPKVRKHLHNVQAFEGNRKPKTKREKTLAKRGRALRKIQSANAQALKGTLSQKAIKIHHTGQLREIKIAQLEDSIAKLQKVVNKPTQKLDPKTRDTTRSLLVAQKAEHQRLLGRREAATAEIASKALHAQNKRIADINKKVIRVANSNAKPHVKARRLQKLQRRLNFEKKALKKVRSTHPGQAAEKAQRHFAKSDKFKEQAQSAATRAETMPAGVPVYKSEKQRKRAERARVEQPTKQAGPLDIPGLGPRRQHKTRSEQGALYRVKRHKGSWQHVEIPAGKYTASQIREFGKLEANARSQPSALQAGLIAADLAAAPLPLAPEFITARLGMIGARGAEALRATRAVRAAESGAEALKGTRLGRTLARGSKGLEAGERAAAKREATKKAIRDLKFDEHGNPIRPKTSLLRRPEHIPSTGRKVTERQYLKGEGNKLAGSKIVTRTTVPERLPKRGPGFFARRKAAAEAEIAAKSERRLTASEQEIVKGAKTPSKAAKQIDEVADVKAPPKVKRAITNTAKSEQNTSTLKAAKDTRIAGGGDPESVYQQMAKSALDEIRSQARATGSGLSLRASRFGKGFAVLASPMVPLAVIDPSKAGHELGAAWRDSHDLVVGFVPSTYQMLTATGSAILAGVTDKRIGSYARVNAIWDQLKQTDPIALAFQGKFKEAYKAVEERPITFAIEATGVYQGFGRTLGRAARFPGLPRTINNIGALEREPFHIAGKLYDPKSYTYSENLITKGLQVFHEKKIQPKIEPSIQATRWNAEEKRFEIDPSKRPDERPSFGGYVRDKYAISQANKRRIELEKAYDEAYAITNLGQRANRSTVEREVAHMINEAHKVHHAAPSVLWLMATKMAKNPDTAIADGERYLQHLKNNKKGIESKHPFHYSISPDETNYLNWNIDVIQQAFDHPELLKDPRLWKLAHDFRDAEDARQQELIDAAQIQKGQSDFSRWIPYAVWHMDNEGIKLLDKNAVKGVHWDGNFHDTVLDKKGAFVYTVERRRVNPKLSKLKGDRTRIKKALSELDPKKNRLAYKGIKSKLDKVEKDIKEFKSKTVAVREKKQLLLKDIEKHAKANKVEGRPAVLTARFLDKTNVNGQFRALGVANPFHRESHGNAVLAGSADTSYQAFQRQAVLSRTTVDKARMWTSLIDRGALRARGATHPLEFRGTETLGPRAEAEAFNQTLGGLSEEYTPVNMAEFRDSLDNMNKQFIVHKQGAKNQYEEMESILQRALKEPTGKQEPVYWLVPKKLIEHLEKHAKIENETGSILRAINREFKGSVLAFSPKWHLGNIADMALRMFFEGVGPTSYVRGRRILNKLENGTKEQQEAYRDIMSLIGGGHLTSVDNSLQEFTRTTQWERDAMKDAQLRVHTTSIRLGRRGYRAILGGYRDFQKGSFWFGHFVEKNLRTAVLGKGISKELLSKKFSYIQRNTWHAIHEQSDIIEEITKGMLDTEKQRKYAHYVNRVMGDYTTMSPGFRRAMLSIAPFALWLRASTRWVLSLPATSPVRVTMIATINRLNEDERNKLGLSAFRSTGHLPFYMLGGITAGAPGTKGAAELYRTNSYTSFGPLTELNIANFAIPQFNNIMKALDGLSWTGDQLLKPNGDPVSTRERYGIALWNALETFVYPVTIAHSVAAHGEPDPTFQPFFSQQGGVFAKPGETWQRFHDRIRRGEPYRNPNDPAQQVQVEADPIPTGQLLLKNFTPVEPSSNFFYTGKLARRHDKQQKALNPVEQHQSDEWETLFGSKPKGKGKQRDKRRKGYRETQFENLFGP